MSDEQKTEANDVLGLFRTNQEAEKAGSWFDVTDTCRLRIARMGNPRYTEGVRRLSQSRGLNRKSRRKLRGSVDTESLLEIMKEAAAKYVLVDWQGVTEHGKEIPYSSDEALRLFNEYPDFYEQVLQVANDRENFREDAIKDAEGN